SFKILKPGPLGPTAHAFPYRAGPPFIPANADLAGWPALRGAKESPDTDSCGPQAVRDSFRRAEPNRDCHIAAQPLVWVANSHPHRKPLAMPVRRESHKVNASGQIDAGP